MEPVFNLHANFHCEPAGKAQFIPIFMLILIPKCSFIEEFPPLFFEKSSVVDHVDLVRIITLLYINLDTIIMDCYILYTNININSSLIHLIDELAGIHYHHHVMADSCFKRRTNKTVLQCWCVFFLRKESIIHGNLRYCCKLQSQNATLNQAFRSLTALVRSSGRDDFTFKVG